MQWMGLLVMLAGALMIGGYYLYELFLYLFGQTFMPFPVRLGLPVIAVGAVLTLLAAFWESIKRSRRERIEEIEEHLTERRPERPRVASQLGSLND